jgi:hypothetical protein
VRSDLTVHIEGVKRDLAAAVATLKSEIAATKVWMLLLHFALAASLLGTMARGLGWI